MEGTPSAADWTALACLWGVVAGGHLATRRRASGAQGRLLPSWLVPAAVVLAHAPAVVAYIQGADLATVAWWLLLATPAAATLLAAVGPFVLLVPGWRQVRSESSDTWRTAALLGLLIAALAVVLGGGGLLVLSEAALRPVAALSLAAAHATWLAALALSRRWTPPGSTALTGK